MSLNTTWHAMDGAVAPDAKTTIETKNAGMPIFAFHNVTGADWSARSYPALCNVGFLQNPVVYRCVRLVSEAAASLPWIVYDGADELAAHPLLNLLNRPNQKQNGQDFSEALYGYLLLAGNAYVHQLMLPDAPAELHLLRPDQVELEFDPEGWPRSFVHKVGKHSTKHPINDDGCSDILHLHLFNPLNASSGHAPVASAQRAIDIHNKASEWNKALLDNSARPSGALVYNSAHDQRLSEEQFDRLKNELEEGYGGSSRAGRPMLLEGGLDWKAMGLTPKDMDFIEARNAAARDISLAFGVPPMLLGIPGDNTYANYKEANRAFWQHTIVPNVHRLCSALTNGIANKFGSGLRIGVDWDANEALQSERDALWQRLQTVDFLTRNEKREALGYGPLAEYDQ